MGERPLCKCHGEPKLWHKRRDRASGGSWDCGVRARERDRARYRSDPEPKRKQSLAHYYTLDSVAYNARLLRIRRFKALQRKQNRHQRLEGIRGEVQA